jgi:Spy/CpxP family protein refolding chaperone
MRKLRMRLGAAVMIALLALSAVSGAAQAQHGADDPCPQHVENIPGCQ